MEAVAVYEMPQAERTRLELAPRLESWDRSDHPDQVRLRAFVSHVRELIDPVADDIDGELALHLDVGLDDSIDPLWQRDLDNYLFPIARALPERYVSVWATKGRAAESTVTIAAARPVPPPRWSRHDIGRVGDGEAAWKRAVRDAVAAAELLPAGPVGMQISLTFGPARNWTGLWKSTIDGLDALLGRTRPDRDWNPQDGRIVRLGLHAHIDPAFGNDVAATIWATPGDLAWPELRWLAEMNDAEREAFLAAHEATLRAHNWRRRVPGSGSTAKTTPVAAVKRGRSSHPVPAGLIELTSEEAFNDAVATRALIVKTDSAGPPKLHTQSDRCSAITSDSFRRKVIVGGGKNGSYFTVADPVVVKQRWPRATICARCRRLDPTGAAAIEAAIS